MTDIKTLWKNQPAEETVTLANIHAKAAQFQRRIFRRNAIEYIASAFVVAVFGWYAWVFPGWMMKTGSVLVILAVLHIVWRLHRQGASRALPDALDLVAFHRRELMRQRQLLRTAWSWYILPTVPGMVLMLLGRWYQAHVPWRTLASDHEVIVLGAIIAALIVAIVWLVQVIGAARLQRKIDELDRLK
ncbi:MAG: hypothetical protein WDM86_02455 [Rhizomicrobium sp.]